MKYQTITRLFWNPVALDPTLLSPYTVHANKIKQIIVKRTLYRRFM